MPFVNRVLHWAGAHADRPAVVVGDRAISYGELAARARAARVPEGRMIALELTDPVEFAIALTAVVGRGRCAAVLDPGWPGAQRARVIEALLPDGVLDSTEMGSSDHPDSSTDAVPESGGPLAGATDDELFYCGFTSGSTGTPKAFVRTVGSWRRSLERSVPYFGITPGLRVFAPGPLSASLSLYALAESLFAGATFYALPAGTGEHTGVLIGDVLRRQRIAHFVGVPAALRLGLQLAGGTLPDLHCVVSGGGKLSSAEVDLVRRVAPGSRLVEYYGASELSLVTVREIGPEEPGEEQADPGIGQPFSGVALRIGPACGSEQRGALQGTVWVRTDTAIEGYLFGGDDHSFTRDGDWVTVGDHGWIDDDGALHLTGRRADMIVVAGTNVYPSEIERALADAGYPLALAVGVPDPARGASLAVVIESPAGAIDTAALLTRLRAELPAVKVPRTLYRVAKLPLTPAGKTDRAAVARSILNKDSALERL